MKKIMSVVEKNMLVMEKYMLVVPSETISGNIILVEHVQVRKKMCVEKIGRTGKFLSEFKTFEKLAIFCP